MNYSNKCSYRTRYYSSFGIISLSLFLLFNLIGCKKLIEVIPPVTSTTGDNVYSQDATAIAVLTGIYAQMSAMNNGNFTTNSFTSISLFSGLSADELTLYDLNNRTYRLYYKNALTNSNDEFWNTIYPILFSVNSSIEGLEANLSLTPIVRSQLIGEAKFMRAFCYFYLINLYGNVPLVLGTNYSINSLLPRSPITEVYNQIINDLKEAKNLLNSNYVDASLINITSERVRPNKWVAISLLAKVYLYIGDYVNSEMASTEVIDNFALYKLCALNDVFLKNSTEAIWQLQPVGTENNANTGDGKLFVLPSSGPDVFYHSVYLNNALVNIFEVGDQRKIKWVDSTLVGPITYYYPYKYKVGDINASTTEYIMMFRLAEQFLIRAEARANLGHLTNSESDLNIIRARSSLPEKLINTKDSLIRAIIQERQLELFTEWGNRWLDLKRTNTIDSVMTQASYQKGSVWNIDDKLYPIPASELLRDHNLVQNPGY